MIDVPSPLSPLDLEALTSRWEETGDPACSVLVPTYMHERFLADALDGILAQRTTFPFEVIVRDDASTDGTRAVAEDYCERYPGIVHLIAHDRRTYPHESPLRELQLRARGEFVAICEGDDYWTDPHKLQRQVDGLRADSTKSLAFHDSIILDERDGPVRGKRHELSPDELCDRSGESVVLNAIPFRSLLFRNSSEAALPEQYSGQVWTEDTFLSARLGLLGDALHVPGISPSVYRLHPGNLSYRVAEHPYVRRGRKIQVHLVIAEYLAAHGRRDLAGAFLLRASGQLASLVASEHPGGEDILASRALQALPWRRRLVVSLRSLVPQRLRGR